MPTKTAIPADLISDTGAPEVVGYDEWKRAKILKGLEQASDRESMIPAPRVWRELGLED